MILYINDTYNQLIQLFFRHYGTNRAPLSLSFDTAWLRVNKGFTKVLRNWMRKLVLDHSDVYFVTNLQVSSMD